jgi:hypothetical protein
MTVTYCPLEGQASPHTALIPWTTNYEVRLSGIPVLISIQPIRMVQQTALGSAKEAFQRYFPSGSANRHRWLSTRVQTSSGITWADFSPQVFANVIEDIGVELRLCEDPAREPLSSAVV